MPSSQHISFVHALIILLGRILLLLTLSNLLSGILFSDVSKTSSLTLMLVLCSCTEDAACLAGTSFKYFQPYKNREIQIKFRATRFVRYPTITPSLHSHQTATLVFLLNHYYNFFSEIYSLRPPFFRRDNVILLLSLVIQHYSCSEFLLPDLTHSPYY